MKNHTARSFRVPLVDGKKMWKLNLFLGFRKSYQCISFEIFFSWKTLLKYGRTYFRVVSLN